jgi:hypothetical protein
MQESKVEAEIELGEKMVKSSKSSRIEAPGHVCRRGELAVDENSTAPLLDNESLDALYQNKVGR